MDNSKYYFIERKTDKAYPLVDIIEDDTEIWEGEFSQRLSKPVMADFLSSAVDIFTKRIIDVMQAMDMEGVHFQPIVIDDLKGTVYDNYVCIDKTEDNVYKLMDEEQSKYVYKHTVYSFSKLVIDRKKLNEIPLNKRLCMRIYEAPGYTLYHQSVVDAIMALEPTGMYFQDIENYEIL